MLADVLMLAGGWLIACLLVAFAVQNMPGAARRPSADDLITQTLAEIDADRAREQRRPE